MRKNIFNFIIISVFLLANFHPLTVAAGIKAEYRSLLQTLNSEIHVNNYQRCGLIDQLRLNQIIIQMNYLSKEMGEQISIFERPDRQDSVLSSDRHYIMYFDTTGDHAVPIEDIEGNGVPDYIDSAGVYLEKSWNIEINQLGFNPPPGIDGNPIQHYPVYFTDFVVDYGIKYYGLTTHENLVEYNGVTEKAYTSFIELHNNYHDFESSGLEGLKVTAAHEFNHAIQFGYFAPEYIYSIYEDSSVFFMEMTSTWLEDYVFDEVNDYVYYLGPFFSDLFEINFTAIDYVYPYANCLYLHMLEKQYGPEIVVDIWNRIIHENAFNAINSELIFRNSSFAQSQNQYAGWLYFTGSRSIPDLYFPEGTQYPEIKLNEGINSFDYGITNQGMRLIELAPSINGLVKAKVNSPDKGKFSHIINHRQLTQPVDFGKEDIVTLDKDVTVIVVLTNPNVLSVTSIDYKVERDKIRTSSVPVVVTSNKTNLEFSNVPENATIRIFNILGQKIQTLKNETSNQIRWNLNASSGKRIATGTYIYHVKAAGFEYAGKLTILR